MTVTENFMQTKKLYDASDTKLYASDINFMQALCKRHKLYASDTKLYASEKTLCKRHKLYASDTKLYASDTKVHAMYVHLTRKVKVQVVHVAGFALPTPSVDA